MNIEGMLKNGRLARSISDAGWSGFLLTLRCKAEDAGIAYVEIVAGAREGAARGRGGGAAEGLGRVRELAKRWVAGRSVAWPGRDRRQSDAIRSILIAFNTMSFEIQVT